MLRFKKYFLRKICRFLGRATVSFMLKFVHNIGFGEKRQFFAENWQKLQKILIITSTRHFGFAQVPWGSML
jgi:hypothetical protein